MSILKKILKSFLRPPYRAAKWLYRHTLKRPPKSLGYIFMLHRVADFEDGHLWCNEHMKVTPSFLDEQLAFLKQNYDIIPLSEVPARLRQNEEVKTGTDLLKEKAGITAEVFAYPFGSSTEAGEREYEILSEMPFACSCIAYGGACTKKKRGEPFSTAAYHVQAGF